MFQFMTHFCIYGPVFGSKVPVKERKAQTCNCFVSIEYEQLVRNCFLSIEYEQWLLAGYLFYVVLRWRNVLLADTLG